MYVKAGSDLSEISFQYVMWLTSMLYQQTINLSFHSRIAGVLFFFFCAKMAVTEYKTRAFAKL